jgi:hypothetical protein
MSGLTDPWHFARPDLASNGPEQALLYVQARVHGNSNKCWVLPV